MTSRVRYFAIIWLALILALQSKAQYSGGSADGSATGRLTQNACAPLSAINVYRGGNTDGFSSADVIQNACANLFVNINYFGGNSDGYAVGNLTQSSCTPLAVGVNYTGGNSDGYSRDTLTQQLCPALFVNVNFFGGNNDGYARGSLIQNACTPLFVGVNYYGGDGDGYDRDTLTQQLCPALFVNVNYFGGVNDGYARGNIIQNGCAPLAVNQNYFGGPGDGYDRDTLIQQLCPALFVNVNYFGGVNDGFARGSLNPSNCTPLIVGVNYYGGTNDGYNIATLQQTNCPALLYYYRTVASGNWTNLATWEYSIDPAFINPPPAIAVTPPSFDNSYEIVVRSPHSVTVNTTANGDDLTINSGGTLSILAGGNFSLNNGTSTTDLTINGTLNVSAPTTFQAGSAVVNNGLFTNSVNTLVNSGTITHNSGAVYRHGFDGGTVPTSAWNTGSTLQITGMVNASTIAGMNQSFHNIEYNSAGQLASFVEMNGNITAINGNLIIANTGGPTREFRLFSNTVNSTSSLTVGGNVLVNAGRLALVGGVASGAANPVLTINGNLSLNFSSVMDMTGNSAGTAAGSTLVLLGNMNLNGTSTLLRSQSTPSVIRFNKASGIQTFAANTPNTAIASATITYQVGNGLNTPELVLNSDFIMNASASMNVNTGAILDVGTSIISGVSPGVNGSFTLNSGSTLKTGNTAGITASTATATGSIQTGTIRSFSPGAGYIYNGFSDQSTGTGLPLTLVSPGFLSIANLGPVVNNTVNLTTSGTTTPLLNMISGKFAIGTGSTLNISNNGNIVVTSADFALGTTGGTVNALGAATFSGNSNPFNVYTSGGVDFGAGTVTIQNSGAFRINNGGSVTNNGPFYSVGSNLEYNTGGNYERSLEWNSASGRGFPHHVNVLNATLNPARVSGSFASTNFDAGGNVSVSSGSGIIMNFGGSNMSVPLIINGDVTIAGSLTASGAAGGNIEVRGNWINNGSGVNFNPNGRTVVFNGLANQDIGGSNATVNPFSGMQINNAAGITLTGANVEVSNQLTLSNGRVNLNNRTFTLGASGSNGTLVGGSSSSYFNSGNSSSRFIRYTTIAGANYPFPVGTGSIYSPVEVNLYSNTSVNANSFISVHVIPSSHPNLGTSTNFLNRYWSVEPTGFGATTHYGINYVYDDADVVGLEPNLKPFKYNPSGWIAATGSGADFEMGAGTVNPGTNTIDWQGLYSFSDFTANGNGTPLPISLLEFNAQPLLDKVELSWTTATEINNDYFTVERSKDGVSFNPVVDVEGAGNSNTVLHYKTMDEEPFDGVSYYRLKQTDFDGRSEYSDIRVVNFKRENKQEWVVYPNPSDLMGINISAANLNSGSVNLRLTDIAGKLVFEKRIPVNGNQIQGFVGFGEVAAGVYNLSLVDGKDVKNFRLILTGK